MIWLRRKLHTKSQKLFYECLSPGHYVTGFRRSREVSGVRNISFVIIAHTRDWAQKVFYENVTLGITGFRSSREMKGRIKLYHL